MDPPIVIEKAFVGDDGNVYVFVRNLGAKDVDPSKIWVYLYSGRDIIDVNRIVPACSVLAPGSFCRIKVVPEGNASVDRVEVTSGSASTSEILQSSGVAPSGGGNGGGSWLTGYAFRRKVTISSSADVNDYQVKLDLTSVFPYLDQNLVLSFHFDRTYSSRVPDSSGRWNDGDLYGGVYVSGVEGNGLEFDGVDDYVDIVYEEDFDFLGDYTIALWVYIESIGDEFYPLITKRDATYNDYTAPFLIYVDNRSSYSRTNALVWGVGDNGTSGETVVVQNYFTGEFNKWVFVTVVMDGNTMKVYKNGELMETNTYSGTRVTNDASVEIGRYDATTDWFFKGKMDEVRIYSRALSADEVNSLYCIGAYRLGSAPAWCSNYLKTYSYSGKDIRFTGPDGTSVLPYWKEDDKTFWVKTDLNVGDNNIYLYYGNGSAGYEGNGWEVFDDFLDFADGPLTISPPWGNTYHGWVTEESGPNASTYDGIVEVTGDKILHMTDIDPIASWAGGYEVKMYKRIPSSALTDTNKIGVEFAMYGRNCGYANWSYTVSFWGMDTNKTTSVPFAMHIMGAVSYINSYYGTSFSNGDILNKADGTYSDDDKITNITPGRIVRYKVIVDVNTLEVNTIVLTDGSYLKKTSSLPDIGYFMFLTGNCHEYVGFFAAHKYIEPEPKYTFGTEEKK